MTTRSPSGVTATRWAEARWAFQRVISSPLARSKTVTPPSHAATTRRLPSGVKAVWFGCRSARPSVRVRRASATDQRATPAPTSVVTSVASSGENTPLFRYDPPSTGSAARTLPSRSSSAP